MFLSAVSTAPRVVRSSEMLPGLLTLTSQSSFIGFRERVTRLRPTSNRVVREQHGMSIPRRPTVIGSGFGKIRTAKQGLIGVCLATGSSVAIWQLPCG